MPAEQVKVPAAAYLGRHRRWRSAPSSARQHAVVERTGGVDHTGQRRQTGTHADRARAAGRPRPRRHRRPRGSARRDRVVRRCTASRGRLRRLPAHQHQVPGALSRRATPQRAGRGRAGRRSRGRCVRRSIVAGTRAACSAPRRVMHQPTCEATPATNCDLILARRRAQLGDQGGRRSARIAGRIEVDAPAAQLRMFDRDHMAQAPQRGLSRVRGFLRQRRLSAACHQPQSGDRTARFARQAVQYLQRGCAPVAPDPATVPASCSNRRAAGRARAGTRAVRPTAAARRARAAARARAASASLGSTSTVSPAARSVVASASA